MALLDAGAPVDEFQRGVANYSNDVYELAIAAFDRLRAAEPDGRQGLAWYYAGLSYMRPGPVWTRASQELDAFMSRWPNSPQWADAAMARARALARADGVPRGGRSVSRAGGAAPDRPQAPKALWQAALLLASTPGRTRRPTHTSNWRGGIRRADEGWRAYQAAGMAFFQRAEWRRAAEIWGEMAAAPAPRRVRPAGRLLLAGPGAARGG